jgi:xylose isomerase
MQERAQKWNADAEIKAILADLAKSDEPDWAGGKYTADKGKQLKAKTYDRVALGARGLAYERLDQLTIEILMGAR